MGAERRFDMARPTLKNPDIDALLTSITGRSRVQTIKSDVCVYGEEDYTHIVDFRDAISAREYSISGMCQTCQDRIFPPEF